MALPAEVARFADLGFAVVPGGLDKRPKVAWKQWQDDPQTPQEQAALGHGSVWGILTGQLYGLVVLDFDGAEGVALAKSLGLTPNVITGSGGWHVWVDATAVPYPVKTCAAVRPGLDVRGEGGLVWVAGRSRKGEYSFISDYRIEGASRVAPLLDLLPERTAPRGGADLAEWDGEGDGTPSALRVLRTQAERVADAQPGTRNQTLNKAAFTVGGLVASGELNEGVAFEVLYQAAQASNTDGVWNPQDMEKTIASAFSSGAGSPWSAEPQVDEDGEIWVSTSDLPKAGEPVRVTAAPAFPLDVYPDELAEFVRQVAQSAGAPVSYVAAAVLPAFGAAAGAHAQLEVFDGWIERPALWTVLVGDPSANKSPALKRALAPIKAAHRALVDDQGEEWTNMSPRQLIVSETTIEGLFHVLQANERGVLLHVDELAGWVKSMGQYKGGTGNDRQHWLSIWSGEDININRAKGNRFRMVKDPFLCVTGGVQPEVLDLLTRDVEDGLAARLLLVPEGDRPARTLRAPRVDAALAEAFSERWNDVADAWAQPDRLVFEGPAFEAYADWYEGAWNSGVGHVRYPAPWGKLPAHVARFALVLSQIRKPGTRIVTVPDVQGAIRLGDYFYAAAEHLYSTVDALSSDEKKLADRAEKVERFIAERGEVTRREIQQRFKYDPRTLDAIADILGIPGLRSSR